MPIRSTPYLYHDLTPRVLSTPRHFAYIKINEGCDHPCTFCVIPQYRGKLPQPPLRIGDLRSHAPVRARRPRDQPDRPGHHGLRRRPRTQGRPRATAGAPRPDRNRAREVGAVPLLLPQPHHANACSTPSPHTTSLVKYIDMPLQHASAAVLKRMKRGANGDIFLKLLERIRHAIPGVAIRTSMIVGFPGETDADFEELCQFVKAAKLRSSGRFLLLRRRDQRQLPPRRQGGRAHHLQPQAPPDVSAAQDLSRRKPPLGRPRIRCPDRRPHPRTAS